MRRSANRQVPPTRSFPAVVHDELIVDVQTRTVLRGDRELIHAAAQDGDVPDPSDGSRIRVVLRKQAIACRQRKPHCTKQQPAEGRGDESCPGNH